MKAGEVGSTEGRLVAKPLGRKDAVATAGHGGGCRV